MKTLTTSIASFVALGMMLFTSCAITEKQQIDYQNYYRKDVKTPAQLFPIEPAVTPVLAQKGDLVMSGTYTTSGQNIDDPKESFTENDGIAEFEQINYISGSMAYALTDKWSVTAQYTGGKGENSVDIESMQATIYDVDVYWTWFLLIPEHDYLPPIEFDANTDFTIGNLEHVKRSYQYRNASLGAGYKIHTGEAGGIYSVFGGVGMGESNITGTTHADNTKVYSPDKNAVPATYGNHRNRYYNAYLQPSIGINLKNWIELGGAARFSFFHSRLSTHIPYLEMNYEEKLNNLLCQPSVFLSMGPKNVKFTAQYALALPLANSSKEHFNTGYLSAGLQIYLPTVKQSPTPAL